MNLRKSLMGVGIACALGGGMAVAQAAVLTFTQSGDITIPALGTGPSASSPYPSTILVSGVVGTVIDVNVVFAGLTHTFPGDIDSLLVGPTGAGAAVKLMSDVGGTTDISGITYTFDDEAATLMGGGQTRQAHTSRRTSYQGNCFLARRPSRVDFCCQFTTDSIPTVLGRFTSSMMQG